MTTPEFNSSSSLIVEEGFFMGSNLEKMLIDAGAEPVLVNMAEAGMENVEKIGFDAAILDVGLQHGGTCPLADELRCRLSPFIFLSAYLTIRQGYTDIPFLDKPFTSESITTALGSLLAQTTHRRRHPVVPVEQIWTATGQTRVSGARRS